jgi:hypothetical protein
MVEIPIDGVRGFGSPLTPPTSRACSSPPMCRKGRVRRLNSDIVFKPSLLLKEHGKPATVLCEEGALLCNCFLVERHSSRTLSTSRAEQPSSDYWVVYCCSSKCSTVH